jgi:hypothetical protein
MKLTQERIKELATKHQSKLSREEYSAFFRLVGLTVKDYDEREDDQKEFELHYKRLYVLRLNIDRSRCVSIGNEFVNFGEGSDGLSIGGIDTARELIRTVVAFAPKLAPKYDGTVTYDGYRDEYSEDELQEAVEVMNEIVFQE